MNSLAKLDKATQMLAEAKSLDEVKEIMDIAEAARTYARAAKLGLDAQNHAAEVKIRAERKAGDLLKQLDRSNGGRPGKTNSSVERVSEYREVLDEQDIPTTTAHRWQQAAQIPEKAFEQHIAQVKDAGLELTTSGLLKSAKVHVAQNTGESEWYTPIEYIACAKAVMGRIDLDPASSEIANKVVGASKIYTAKDDGLSKFWAGKVWMNPPYSAELVRQFISKFVEHVSSGDITEGIVLVNNATETQWFADLVSVSSAVLFPTGRVKFLDPKGNPGAPLQGQALTYSGKNVSAFVKQYEGFGWIAKL
jgi:phage N-6-adenine-methyltransferase